ncbi:DUF6541 family protein [Actinomyces gaoshouyii]|uniref:Beta-carotene 15,15'-monooxygenase n=1 Tax=Actinomyces gaoshouyii TaxID=1960083 RepID=A0A8H9H8R6_9ACTO|nr:DUF6541 family protein [Actinomyces gaoshouyii]GGO96079.1 hypothetical protein GCM10011612_05430 [Actinomyces gaoshouyii]
MSAILAWLPYTGRAALLLLILFAPGMAILRGAGYRRLFALGAAPPLSLSVVTLTGIVCRHFSIRYHGWALGIGALAIVGLVVLLTRKALGPLPSRSPYGLAPPRLSSGRAVLAAALGAALIIAAPIALQWDPALPVQQIDSVFHYNLAWTIEQTGNASLLAGASWSFSLRAIPAYYPLVWHAVVAGVGRGDIVGTTNTLVVLVPLVWTLGIAVLAREAFPASRWAPVMAPLVATLLPAYPVYMIAFRQLWPNALGYAVLPAILAMLLRVVRLLEHQEEVGRRRVVITLAIFAVALLGAIAAYPSTLFAFCLTGLPLLGRVLIALGRGIRRRIGPRAMRYLVGGAIIGALAAAAALVLDPAVLGRLGRSSYAGFSGLLLRIAAMITLWPMGGGRTPFLLTLAIQSLLILLGLVVTARRRDWRWIVLAWAAPMLVLAAAYFPLRPLTALTGLWYNDPYRIIPLVIPAIALLGAAALDALMDRLAAARHRVSGRRMASAVICALVIGGLGAMPARLLASRSAYSAAAPTLVEVLSADEAEMIRSLPGSLDPDLMVLGDPAAGAAYVQALGGQRSVFPHMTFRGLDTDALYLAKHFARIRTDPRVCEIVRHYGIGYYYADAPGRVLGIDPVERAPGLYGVDVSQGFEEVASGGGATIYRITACGPVSTDRYPWTLDSAEEPLLDVNPPPTFEAEEP